MNRKAVAVMLYASAACIVSLLFACSNPRTPDSREPVKAKAAVARHFLRGTSDWWAPTVLNSSEPGPILVLQSSGNTHGACQMQVVCFGDTDGVVVITDPNEVQNLSAGDLVSAHGLSNSENTGYPAVGAAPVYAVPVFLSGVWPVRRWHYWLAPNLPSDVIVESKFPNAAPFVNTVFYSPGPPIGNGSTNSAIEITMSTDVPPVLVPGP